MTAGPRRGAAVLGSPIEHSLSPVLHTAAYAGLGLTGWDYRAVQCDEASLAATLRDLDSAGLAGVSLTMPLKRAVLPMLARTERLAADVGAANTVLFGGIEGEWFGANTDVPGMVAALRRAGLRLDAGHVPWVLGGGATACSAVAAVSDLGAGDVVVVARRPQATDDVRRVAALLGIGVEVRPWSAAAGCVEAPLVVSTTPSGSTDEVAESVSAARGRTLGMVFDVVYAPWPTPFAAAWRSAGGTVVGGLELLVEQAGEQVRLMTGREAPVEAMRRAGRAALHRQPLR